MFGCVGINNIYILVHSRNTGSEHELIIIRTIALLHSFCIMI